MNTFKGKFIQVYLLPQEKKWVRVIESLSAIGSFISVLIALYTLYTFTEPKKPFSNLLILVSWGYLIASIPLFFLLLKESQLKKYERNIIEFFILLSTIGLMLAVFLSLTNPIK